MEDYFGGEKISPHKGLKVNADAERPQACSTLVPITHAPARAEAEQIMNATTNHKAREAVLDVSPWRVVESANQLTTGFAIYESANLLTDLGRVLNEDADKMRGVARRIAALPNLETALRLIACDAKMTLPLARNVSREAVGWPTDNNE